MMKIYDYDTIFTFGKHRGKRLIDVILSDWAYINWCQEHLDNFILSENMMYVLKEPNGEFQFSELATKKRENNLAVIGRHNNEKGNRKIILYEQNLENCSPKVQLFYNKFFDQRIGYTKGFNIRVIESSRTLIIIRKRISDIDHSFEDYEIAHCHAFRLQEGEIVMYRYADCIEGKTMPLDGIDEHEEEMIEYIKQHNLVEDYLPF